MKLPVKASKIKKWEADELEWRVRALNFAFDLNLTEEQMEEYKWIYTNAYGRRTMEDRVKENGND